MDGLFERELTRMLSPQLSLHARRKLTQLSRAEELRFELAPTDEVHVSEHFIQSLGGVAQRSGIGGGLKCFARRALILLLFRLPGVVWHA